MTNLSKYRPAGELDATIFGKLLYLILLDLSDFFGKVTIPQREISEALGVSKSTVSRNLRRLEESGYLEILEQYNRYGTRIPNKYVILED